MNNVQQSLHPADLARRSTSKRNFFAKLGIAVKAMMAAGDTKQAEKLLGYNHEGGYHRRKHNGRTVGAFGMSAEQRARRRVLEVEG